MAPPTRQQAGGETTLTLRVEALQAHEDTIQTLDHAGAGWNQAFDKMAGYLA